MLKLYKLIPVVISVVVTIGCSNHIHLQEETVPVPLVPTLPTVMAIYFDESMQNVTAEVRVPKFGDLTVYLDAAQTAGFDKVFNQLFVDTKMVDSPNSIPMGYDALIIVEMDSFTIYEREYTGIPYLFLVEVEYDIKVETDKNILLHHWKIKGEGQSYDAEANPAPLIKEASEVAIRDALADLIFSFIEASKNNYILQARSQKN